MYNSKSKIAEEFIDDEEIQDTLAYAAKNKNNRSWRTKSWKKARNIRG